MSASGAIWVFGITGLAVAYIIWDIRKAERAERSIREALDIANNRPKGPEDDPDFMGRL